MLFRSQSYEYESRYESRDENGQLFFITVSLDPEFGTWHSHLVMRECASTPEEAIQKLKRSAEAFINELPATTNSVKD